MRARAIARAIGRLVTLAGTLYLAGILAWAAGHWLWGDRWWWLFALNAFAPYLFAPLPIVAIGALALRRWSLVAPVALVALLGGVLIGPSYALGRPAAMPDAPILAVMTYNAYGFAGCESCVVGSIRAAAPDLVVLQELTPGVAAAIGRDLGEEYPYQVLAPDPGVIGMGAISRYPLRETGETLDGSWAIPPQILALDFADTAITVVNAHPDATPPIPGPVMEATIRRREAQVRAVADFATAHDGPLIVPGDYNTTDRNAAYRTLAGPLRDAWRVAGRGFGHTFPGGGSYPRNWLVRIDYIFSSPHWAATEARVLPWDGASDHRPLLAKLALRR